MKKYLREKKKWVSEEEYEAFHAKKIAGVCKGNRPHDFVLVLPSWGVQWDGVTKYDAEAYYKAMEEREEFIKSQDEELVKKGILVRACYSSNSRHYACSVCQKRKYC